MSGTRTVSVVPLATAPQSLSISLNGVLYNLTLAWNTVSSSWTLNIADINGNDLLDGIPLVTGCDLLEQYSYIGINGSLYVMTSGDPDAVPTFTNLGDAGQLYFVAPQDPPPQ